ncbi:MAG: hypothetical protein Q9165_005700 [Trypethelium subeluteriae]
MPHAINTMKHKRPRDPHLQQELHRERPPGDSRRDRRRLEVPAKQRRDEVRGAEDVQAAREHRAGDAVQDRRDPGDLRLVDAEVRRDGPFQPLLLEDGVGGGRGDAGLLGGAACSVGGRFGDCGRGDGGGPGELGEDGGGSGGVVDGYWRGGQ